MYGDFDGGWDNDRCRHPVDRVVTLMIESRKFRKIVVTWYMVLNIYLYMYIVAYVFHDSCRSFSPCNSQSGYQ